MRRVLVTVVVAAAAVVITDAITIGVRAGGDAEAAPAPVAAPSPTPTPPAGPLDVSGLVVLGSAYGGTAADWTRVAGGCTGAGAFTAIVAGAPLAVQDATTMRALASVTLGAGRVVVTSGRATCAFAFRVPDLPQRASYVLSVRGLQPVTRPYAVLATGVLEIDPTAS